MKKMLALIVALMMVLFSVSAMAETTALKAATSPDYPPFESLDDSGNVIGFDADLAAAISKLIGQDITFESTNFDSIIAGVQTGTYDLGLSCLSITEERLANVDFTTPYAQNGPCLIMKADSGITDNASVMGKKIGVQTGTTAVEAAEALTDESNVFSYTKALDAVMDLQGNKLDAVITDTPVAEKILAELGDDTLVVSDAITFEAEYYAIALAKGQDELKAKLNSAIESLIADGTIDKLAETWNIYGTADVAAE
ncbi:MAG TPA: transporter substrate-binding domain-containing protein [Candidatus Limiplasma sp.]|nr:transporter substrate-binding domain-containing protein [Candidatus Limiplasma sp.]HPS82448.1 transporter substrate-binding domain-containing protein [Candidatus Limiplasma sp.]